MTASGLLAYLPPLGGTMRLDIVDLVPNVSVDHNGRPYAWVKFNRPLTDAERVGRIMVPDHDDEVYHPHPEGS